MSEPRDRPVIEVTEEMIAAGVDAFLQCDRDDDLFEMIVKQVFQAMMSAAAKRSL
jgi:hypothetical protein